MFFKKKDSLAFRWAASPFLREEVFEVSGKVIFTLNSILNIDPIIVHNRRLQNTHSMN